MSCAAGRWVRKRPADQRFDNISVRPEADISARWAPRSGFGPLVSGGYLSGTTPTVQEDLAWVNVDHRRAVNLASYHRVRDTAAPPQAASPAARQARELHIITHLFPS